MKEYCINFNGCCKIKAKNIEYARTEFWRIFSEELALSSNIYNIENIKEDTG